MPKPVLPARGRGRRPRSGQAAAALAAAPALPALPCRAGRLQVRPEVLLCVLRGAAQPRHVRDAAGLGAAHARRHRDVLLAQRQHQAVPQVRQAGGEERRVSGGRANEGEGAGRCGASVTGHAACAQRRARMLVRVLVHGPLHRTPLLARDGLVPAGAVPCRSCNLVLCRCGQAFCWLCGQATGRAHTWTNIEGHSCGAYKEEAEARANEASRQASGSRRCRRSGGPASLAAALGSGVAGGLNTAGSGCHLPPNLPRLVGSPAPPVRLRCLSNSRRSPPPPAAAT